MSDYDLTREQAAGIVANLAYESAGFKAMQEYEPLIPGSRGGYGYAQWTGSRRRDFERFVDDKDWDIRSYQANYGNLKRELDGEYGYVIDLIKEAKTTEQASDVFAKKFERPKPETANYARRAQLAQDILVNPNTGFIAPFPTERGVSAQTDLVRRQMLDPHSGDMGLAPRQEPAWSSQFAPGGSGLLGADPITPQAPLEHFGPPVPRSDYLVGPSDRTPWVDDHAPVPGYPPQTASPERFEKTFARPDPHAPVLQPGMSDRAGAVAMRDLADTMAQAGIAGLDGRRMAAQSAVNEGPGLGSVESGMPSAPHAYDPGMLHRVPVPKARPGRDRPMTAPVPKRRPGAVGIDGAVPVPTTRPVPRARPTPSTIPVPTPAPRGGAGLVPTRGAIAPLGPYAFGPKQQIFDFVLGKLLNPGRPAK